LLEDLYLFVTDGSYKHSSLLVDEGKSFQPCFARSYNFQPNPSAGNDPRSHSAKADEATTGQAFARGGKYSGDEDDSIFGIFTAAEI